MIVLKRTHDVGLARVIVSFLVANEIDAKLLDGETSSTIPLATGGVRIVVPQNQKYMAEKLLEDIESKSGNDTGSN